MAIGFPQMPYNRFYMRRVPGIILSACIPIPRAANGGIRYIESSHIGFEKPRKEIFLHANALAGMPDMCVMIGDNPIADIERGHMAGMRTVLVHRDVDVALKADVICRTLAEVPAVLGSII